MLAVGTRSGRVWLWRYRMPTSYSLAVAKDSIEDSFALVSQLLLDPLCMPPTSPLTLTP